MSNESTPTLPHFSESLNAERYEAASLRRAGLEDLSALTELYCKARGGEAETRESMAAWLGKGGCLVLAAADRSLLCALRWREAPPGWEADRIATLPAARGNNYGRWLMTKLEALAIRTNIPTISLALESPDAELLTYYQRMGYRVTDHAGASGAHGSAPVTLQKKVGGMWQYQGRSA